MSRAEAPRMQVVRTDIAIRHNVTCLRSHQNGAGALKDFSTQKR